jgi:hypothetical protein
MPDRPGYTQHGPYSSDALLEGLTRLLWPRCRARIAPIGGRRTVRCQDGLWHPGAHRFDDVTWARPAGQWRRRMRRFTRWLHLPVDLAAMAAWLVVWRLGQGRKRPGGDPSWIDKTTGTL